MTKAERKILKEQAKELYAQNGLDAKSIATKIGVSETALSRWINDYGWKAEQAKLPASKLSPYALNRRNILSIKKEAKKLYVGTPMTAKAVSQKLRIGEKTMSSWVKLYGWKAERERVLKQQLLAVHPDKVDTRLTIGYWDFMKEKHPRTYNHITKSITEYLKLKA